MKMRVLFMSLALALVLTALMPAPVSAESHKLPAKSTPFTGSGLIYVTYMPDEIIKGNNWHYQGEVVEGFLSSCDWDLLVGASFYSVHDSKVKVDEEGNIKGKMEGTFILTRPNGSTLEGKFSGKITGNNYFDPTVTIVDEGKWKSTKGTGDFEGVKAKGTWSAHLYYGPIPGTPIWTLVGPLTWDGKWDSGKKPKPLKPWKTRPRQR